LQPSRDPSRSPLFQTMLILQAVRPGEDPGLAAFSLGEAGARAGLEGLSLESVRLGERRAQFDLTLRLAPVADGGLGAVLEYAADLFEDDTAGRMLGHFPSLLAGAVADPARRLWDLPLLTGAERHQLLVVWNEAGSELPRRDVCLHDLFAEQVQRTPDAEALVDGRTRLTYGELAARSRRWAGALRDLGVGPEVRVGVCLPRSADLVAVLLGVLEAGGAYVPLDPAYPRERIAFMLEDSGAQVLVTSPEVAPEVPGFKGRRIEMKAGGPHDSPPVPTRPHPAAGPHNLAYLIYTSGSTGRPKGVAIEHRSAAALVEWSRGVFSPEDLAGVLAVTSVCFDLSIFEIFVPLSRGGRVILAENALALPKLPASSEVTLVNTVPSAMAELVRSGKVPRSVRVINLAGEPIPPALAAAIHDLEGPRLYDLYGPSEDTTYSTGTLLVPGGDVTIGRPIAGTRGYVLDHRGGPVPAGVPGELYLGGAGLARGYLGRPDLTAERFVPDALGEVPGGRLYRTGDLVRLRRDGDLDFLGRIDHQVKVRGYRIELGEVEAAIAREPEVRGVAVLALDDGAAADSGRRLAAFVATDLTDLAPVRDSLRRALPEPMVPTRWVALPELPLTPNGKVDRRALARLEVRSGPLEPGGNAPRGGTEERLAALWSEVLGVPRVGRHDDFFDLGGHSLLATRLAARLHAASGFELPLSAVLRNPTVARLAAFLEQTGGAAGVPKSPPIRPVSREGGLPLSFAQERLWFLDRLVPGSAAYNIPAAIHLSGPLRAAALERALGEVVRRHEALRTVFGGDGGPPVQIVLLPAPPALPVIDLAAGESEAARLAGLEAARPFDLQGGPLLRALLLRLAPEEHVLVLVLHHIVADGWSAGVLLGELAALYDAFAAGRPSPLPELPVQYADYAAWQREHMRGEVLASHVEGWRARLAGLPVLELPADHPRPAVPGFRGAARRTTLPASLAADLRALGQSQGSTPFMTLLAAFAVLLGRAAGEERLAVGSPVANRGRVEVEGLIGLFVNSLVLPLDLAGDPVFPDLLARVRETCLAAFAHQDLPFERLVEELRPEREPGRNPLFQVLFALEEPLAAREAAGVRFRPEPIENGTAKLDLTFTLTPRAERGLAGRLVVEARYDSDLFEAVTIERLLGQFQILLEGLAADPGARLSALPLLGAAERHQLLREWNDTEAPPPELPVYRLIAAQAARTPGRTAVALGNRAMTYGELAERAGDLA
ncbi:MAG TPA: amino acid adenylation domain-containing protein, partial [Thermoanaerobaculia bacterium]|nr:amino acid adenylation domain-containing protein [Thermoanaerobaculia bacterium]